MMQKNTTYWRCLNVLLVTLLTVGTLTAQIKITFPVERAVFQRNNANQASISIGGIIRRPLTASKPDSFQYRWVKAKPPTGLPSNPIPEAVYF